MSARFPQEPERLESANVPVEKARLNGHGGAARLRPRMSPPPLAQKPPEGTYVRRFTRTERAVHWTHAVTFLILVATGLTFFIPQLATLVNNRYLVRQIHLAAAFCFVVLPTLISLVGNRKAMAEDVREVDEWDNDDMAFLAGRPGVDGSKPPKAGKFNAGQKVNAIFSVGSVPIFAGSGLIMWQHEYFGHLFGSEFVTNASQVHDILAFLAIFMWLGHIFLALVYPPTRESIRGMTKGYVKAPWAYHHHEKWFAKQDVLDKPPAEE